MGIATRTKQTQRKLMKRISQRKPQKPGNKRQLRKKMKG